MTNKTQPQFDTNATYEPQPQFDTNATYEPQPKQPSQTDIDTAKAPKLNERQQADLDKLIEEIQKYNQQQNIDDRGEFNIAKIKTTEESLRDINANLEKLIDRIDQLINLNKSRPTPGLKKYTIMNG